VPGLAPGVVRGRTSATLTAIVLVNATREGRLGPDLGRALR
jgi:hypothetical protein